MREGHTAPPTWAFGLVRKLVGSAAAFALVSLLCASVAFAEPPANDRFEDAQVVGPALPILAPGSNVGAGKEASGEPYDVFAAGHSVWFNWTAPSDEVVTVDTCDSEFPTSLTVFRGSSLGALTEVGRDSNSDGRFCPDASGVTFRPVLGTTYSIMVDGNGFYLPEGSPPVTEGSFELKVAATPSPPNDDFAHAIPIETSASLAIEEEFSYSAWSDGFTWNATKEAGEPDHAGDPGGASVWYRWTAPRSGHAEVGACVSFNVLLGLYTGNAVNDLTSVPLESRPAPCFVNFAATAGTTYRIAVDGKLDTGTGLPAMTSFGIHASMSISAPRSKSGAAVQSGPSPDKAPPNTTIRRQVLRSQPPQLVFHFSSNEPGSTFRCKLDKQRFAKCRSSKRFRHLAPGSHTLEVFAVDPAGNADPSPAIAHFTFPSKVKAHSRH